ncbi:MAG: hypothetical protein IJC18_05570 [Clostridia bacterium]|nr:hypothetical protein [Clostridia bacterium]
MDNDYTMAANAAEEVSDVQETASYAEDGTPAESSDAAAHTDAPEDITQTQAFSRRLNEMSARRVDDSVRSLGQVNPYTGKPVETEQDMRDLQAMREADDLGQDPATAVRIRSLEAELARYRSREAEASLLSDPVLGGYYERYRDDVADFVDFAAQEGKAITHEQALRAILADNLDEILRSGAERARQETLAQIGANTSASPGSIGGAVVENTGDFARMSDEEFEKAIAAAKRGELKI